MGEKSDLRWGCSADPLWTLISKTGKAISSVHVFLLWPHWYIELVTFRNTDKSSLLMISRFRDMLSLYFLPFRKLPSRKPPQQQTCYYYTLRLYIDVCSNHYENPRVQKLSTKFHADENSRCPAESAKQSPITVPTPFFKFIGKNLSWWCRQISVFIDQGIWGMFGQ